MVTGRSRFNDSRLSLREQARQQDGTLDLGAGDWHLVANAAQRCRSDTQWSLALPAADVGPHPRQGRDDAFHGPATQLGAAIKHGSEGLTHHDARHQANAGPGIGEIQRLRRCLQNPAAVDVKFIRCGTLQTHAKRYHAAQGRFGIARCQPTAHGGRTFGQRCEHHRTVGNGLVAGDGGRAPQVLRGLYDQAG